MGYNNYTEFHVWSYVCKMSFPAYMVLAPCEDPIVLSYIFIQSIPLNSATRIFQIIMDSYLLLMEIHYLLYHGVLFGCILLVYEIPITPQQELENKIMNVIRISIKDAFVVLCSWWIMITQYSEFKLGFEHRHTK